MRVFIPCAAMLHIGTIVFAGEQHAEAVHQYLVRESYALLREQIGGDIPVMSSHIGTTQQGGGQFDPGGLMVIGAYQEDHNDVVYHYYTPFGWTVTATHFWEPDNGDNALFVVRPTGTYENALMKARKFFYGGYEIRVWYPGSGIAEAYEAPPYLPAFYTSGSIYYKGFYDVTGRFTARNRWTISPQWLRDRIVWEILGRVSHLLADVATPAHAHFDQHDPILGGIDSYETSMASLFVNWDHTHALAQGGFLNVTRVADPLKFLFYSTAQIADHFPSNHAAGDNSNGLNDPFGNYPPLQDMIRSLGAPPPSINPAQIAATAFVYSMRSIAGLFYWFAYETGLVRQLVVQTDFAGGQVIVNSVTSPSGVTVPCLNGATVALATIGRQTPADYPRFFDHWEKRDAAGSVIASYPGINWPVTIDGNHTYCAVFNRLFTVTLCPHRFVEQGTGGTYRVGDADVGAAWQGTYLERRSSPIKIEAVPVPGWVFAGWSDAGPDKYANPRFLEPRGTMSIFSSDKMHLSSSSPNVFSYNSQRKLISAGGIAHLAYQSGEDVYYTCSSDLGETWVPEQVVSSDNVPGPKTNPVIDVDAAGTPYVAYEYPGGGSRRTLVVRRKAGPPWQLVALANFSATTDLKPSLSVTKNIVSGCPPQFTVAVQAADWDGVGAGIYAVHFSGTSLMIGRANQTSSASCNPAISGAVLAYQEGNAIFSTLIGFGPPLNFAPRTTLSTEYVNGRQVRDIANPTIAMRSGTENDPRPVVAWQATDLVFPSYRPVFVRHPVGTDASGKPVFITTVFDWGTSNAHGRSPTVVCYQTPAGSGGAQNPDLSVVWQDDPLDPAGAYRDVMVANKINGVWGMQSVLLRNTLGSSVAHGTIAQDPVIGGALVAWQGASGPPYPLSASSRTNSGIIAQSVSAPLMFEYARGGQMDLASLAIAGLEGEVSVEAKENPGCVFRQFGQGMHAGEGYLDRANLTSTQLSTIHTISVSRLKIPQSFTAVQGRTAIFSVETRKDSITSRETRAFTLDDAVNLWEKCRITSDSGAAAERKDEIQVAPGGMVRVVMASGVSREPKHLELYEFLSPVVQASAPGRNAGADVRALPKSFELHQNYPNPFNGCTRIDYEIRSECSVSLAVYDVLGRRVAELAAGDRRPGFYSAVWDGTSEAGTTAASGNYLARLSATSRAGEELFRRTIRMLMVK